MAGKKIGIVLALDGEKKFAQGISNANQVSRALKAELNKLSVEFDGNANSMEYLTKKQEILSRQTANFKQKIKSASEGLANAEGVQKKAAARYEELTQELEDTKKALGELKNAGKEGTKEYEKQEKAVKAQERALERQSVEITKCEGKIASWSAKLVNAETDLEKHNRELKRNAQYLSEAEKASDHCATSIDRFGKAAQEATKTTSDWGEKLLTAVTAKGVSEGFDLIKDGVSAAAQAIGETMIDASKASSQLAASTGLSESAAKRYQQVMKSIKGDNFGQDYGDVADAMAQVIQVMGELDDSSMKEVTESAITLRDTFGMDVNESIRAVDVMMKTMGVDATTAFDLITTGAQNGLNRSGELVDNITEYGQLWGQAGFSAEQMFAILENGLDAGAYNLDKVNDYVKEFGNSLADGRIEDNLSSFSGETQNLFQQWKNGNASTSDVFYSVINDLSEMTNQQEALTLASEVWSALGEDNAMQVLTALDDVNDKYKDVKGSMESLKEVRYSDLESAVSGLGAAVQENFVAPIADAALPTITGLFEKATEVINGIGGAIAPQKSDIQDFVDGIKTSNDEIQSMLDNASQIMESADIDVSNLEVYKQTITELNDLENASGLQKYELQQAVNNLAGDIPELAEAWDSETERINLSKEAITDLIDQHIAYKKETAASLALQETYNAKIAAEANQLKIDSAIEDLEARIEKTRELNEATETFKNGGYGDHYVELTEMENALDDLMKEQKEANAATEEAVTQYDTLAQHVETLTAKEANASDKTKEHNEVLSENTDTLEENAAAAKAGAEAQKEAAKSILDTYHGYVDEIKADLQNKINPFEKFDASESGEDLSVEKMTENLQSQNEAFEKYAERLETVKDHVGKEISPEFMKYLENMGMEGDNTLKHILATFDETPGEFSDKVKAFNDEYLRSLNLTEEIAEVGAVNKVAYEMAMGEMGSSDADFSELRESIAGAVSGPLKEELESSVDAAQECGIKIPEGLAEGIAGGEVSPEAAIAQLNGSMQGAFAGLLEIAKEAGVTIQPEIAAGIEAGGQEAAEAFSQLVQEIAGKSPELQSAIEEGTNTEGVKSNIQAGVEGGADAITEAASKYETNANAIGEAIASGITKSGEAVKKAVSQIVEAAAGTINEKADNYKQAGAALGESVSDGLQEALSADDGAVILNPNSISDKAGEYTDAGRSLGEAVVTGLKETQEAINNAVSPNLSGMDTGNATNAGTALGEAFATAIEASADKSTSSGNVLGQSAARGALKQIMQMRTAGEQSAQMYISAINAAKGSASAAGSGLALGAYSGAASYSGTFYGVGVNMSAGLASGISAGGSAAIRAAASVAAQSLAAAKAALAIHSPSKKFRNEVGRQIPAGMAFGIRDKASLAGDAASKMSDQVFAKATAWLKKYKKSHKVSLADEKYYWQQVAKHTKTGTDAYNKAISKMLKSSVSKTTKSGKKKVKKSTETYYSEILSAAQKYASNQQVLNDWSLKRQVSYWTAIRKQLKKGTQAWYDATKEIKNLQANIKQAAQERVQTQANVQKDILDKYKVYNEVSAKAEMQYWDIARKQFKNGTDERIEADENYLKAKEEYCKRKEEYAEKEKDINDELADSIKELRDTYDEAVASRKKDILSSMNLFESWDAGGYDKATLTSNLKTQVEGVKFWKEQIEELGKKNISKELLEELSDMGPEAAANIWSLNQMTAEELKEYEALWVEKNEIAHKQAVKENANLMKETEDAIAKAEKTAKEKLEDLKKNYRDVVKDLNEGLSDGLKGLVNQAGKIGEEIVSKLVSAIKDANTSSSTKAALSNVSKIINSSENSLYTGSASSASKGQAAISAAKAKENNRQRILAIINSGKPRKKTLTAKEKKEHVALWEYIATKYGRTATNAMYGRLGEELGVKTSKTPTSAQKNAILKKLKEKGFASGTKWIKEDDNYWVHDGEILVRKSDNATLKTLNTGDGVIPANLTENLMKWGEWEPQIFLAQARASLQAQNDALRQQMYQIDSSGIPKLNRLMEDYQPKPTMVNVDNSDMIGMMQQVLTKMKDMVDAIAGMQMITDTGTLIGELQPGLSRENAAITIRKNRGRL